MKKQLVARIRLYGKSLFFTTTTVLILNISASAQSANNKVSLSDQATITHLESKEASSLFHVRIPNATGEKFSLLIKDVGGSILYRGVFDDKEFDRKFLITDIDKDAKLLFTITPLKSKASSQTFEVNSVSRIVDDVVVTKLK